MPLQNIPESTQKTNLVLYIVAIIGFTLALLLFGFGISSLTTFMDLSPLIVTYIPMAIISLIIGFVAALIINKIAKSNKLFILASSIISFFGATTISIVLSSLKKTLDKIHGTQEAGAGMVGFFGEPASGLIVGILIIIFFNVPFLIYFFKKQDKAIKDLLIYLYGVTIFLVLYFTVPLVIV